MAAGTQTLHTVSCNTQTERNKAMGDLNDKETPYTALISFMKPSAFGVDFHRACHQGIILFYMHRRHDIETQQTEI